MMHAEALKLDLEYWKNTINESFPSFPFLADIPQRKQWHPIPVLAGSSLPRSVNCSGAKLGKEATHLRKISWEIHLHDKKDHL